tara:strand:+ start:31008 stop:31439 length:432 start_codon:yes stop_codon:yes gene_type:complete
MLNVVEIVQRIESIRNNHQLSSAGFASKIGVQRSAMSHILSGRNKPSLEFLVKIYEAFDEVALEWLIMGIQTPTSSTNKSDPFNSQQVGGVKSQTPSFDYHTSDKIVELDQNEQSISSTESVSPKEIIYLYEDGSFERFTAKK